MLNGYVDHAVRVANIATCVCAHDRTRTCTVKLIISSVVIS